MRLLDHLVGAAVATCILSCIAYFLVHWVFQLQLMTCFGAQNGMRPFVEHQVTRDVSYVFGVSKLLEKIETKYQSVEVYSHPYFGHILVIDQSLQITERDEANYHEMMAHVPLAYMPQAKKALMIGGGDGGAVWRVLQHANIQQALLVDIDMRIMREISRKYFSNLYQAYTDPRTLAFSYDGAQWLTDHLEDEANHGSVDLIMVDSTDYGAAESLFTNQFYTDLLKLMNKERSALILNVDSPSWNMDIVVQVQRQLAQLFRYCYVFHTHQPTFLSGHYGFLFASNTIHPLKQPVDWAAWYRKEIPTYYYTPDVHYAAFVLPALLGSQLTMTAQLEDIPAFPSPGGATAAAAANAGTART